MMKQKDKIKYKILEVSEHHLVAEFYLWYIADVTPDYDEWDVSTIGFVEVWNGNGCVYTNIFQNQGLYKKHIKKIMRIIDRLYLLNKLKLLKKRG